MAIGHTSGMESLRSLIWYGWVFFDTLLFLDRVELYTSLHMNEKMEPQKTNGLLLSKTNLSKLLHRIQLFTDRKRLYKASIFSPIHSFFSYKHCDCSPSIRDDDNFNFTKYGKSYLYICFDEGFYSATS